MTLLGKIGFVLAAVSIGVVGSKLSERVPVPGISSFVSSAEARVGRPLTPVSVAGAARARCGGVRQGSIIVDVIATVLSDRFPLACFV